MAIDKPFGSLEGAPLLTQFAITQTEKLAETIERYEKDDLPVPEHLTASISQLSSHLEEFQPDNDIELFLGPGMDPEQIVYNNLEVAWYVSACLYFYNRLDNTFIDDVPFFVNTILMCLLRAEEIKTLVEPDVLRRRVPITFPAFVASCNATKRDPWVGLWNTIQQYENDVANSQWMTVQHLWDLMRYTAESGVDLTWVELMRGLGEAEVRLSTQYVLLEFYPEYAHTVRTL